MPLPADAFEEQTRSAKPVPDVLKNHRSFVLDWIDRQVGTAENRRLIVLYAAPVQFGDAAASPEASQFADHTARFHAFADAQIKRFGGRIDVGPTSGTLGYWPCLDASDCRGAIAAGRAICAWRSQILAVACAIDAGTVLVDRHVDQPDLVDDGNAALVGTPLDTAVRSHGSALPAQTLATDSFRNFAAELGVVTRWCPIHHPADALGMPLYELTSALADSQCGGAAENPSNVAAAVRLCHTHPDEALPPAGASCEPPQLPAHPCRLTAVLDTRVQRAGALRRLAAIAAAATNDFDVPLLGQILAIEHQHLAPLLDRLAALQLVLPLPGPGKIQRYRFCDPLLRSAAYHLLPPPVRKRLHARTAQALVATSPAAARSLQRSVQIADQFARAGESDRATQWWRAAADDAVQECAPHLAIALLQSAHDGLLGAATRSARAQRTEICRLLSTQLATLKGNGAPDVYEAYRQCPAPPRNSPLRGHACAFDTKWVLLSCYLTGGEVGKAVEISRRLLHIAEAAARTDLGILAHRMVGLSELLHGRLDCSRTHLTRAIDLYDFAQHADLTYQYGSDQLALAYAHRAWANAIAGRVHAAECDADRAIRQAERIDQVHTRVHVTGVLGMVFEIVSQRASAATMTLAADALAQRHEYRYWTAWASMVAAILEGELSAASAHRRLSRVMQEYRATGHAPR